MTKFKTVRELEKYMDTAIVCLCGRLTSGRHMQACKKLRNQQLKLERKEVIKNG